MADHKIEDLDLGDFDLSEVEYGAELLLKGVEAFNNDDFALALDLFDQGSGRARQQANELADELLIVDEARKRREEIRGEVEILTDAVVDKMDEDVEQAILRMIRSDLNRAA